MGFTVTEEKTHLQIQTLCSLTRWNSVLEAIWFSSLWESTVKSDIYPFPRQAFVLEAHQLIVFLLCIS